MKLFVLDRYLLFVYFPCEVFLFFFCCLLSVSHFVDVCFSRCSYAKQMSVSTVKLGLLIGRLELNRILVIIYNFIT